MQRRIRVLGAGLLLLAVVIFAFSVAVQLDDGFARSVAESSTCNYEPCTTEQLQRLDRIAGPVTVLLLGGFGVLLLRARVQTFPGRGEGASDPEPVADGDVGERLRSIDRLREEGGITPLEHAEQRRRILGSI